jgi:hypothetical protein
LPTKVEDIEVLRRFLLNEASEQERDEIEELYFSDQEFLERLIAAEGELVEDYLKGDLPAREREKFERQYSANVVNRGEVDFSRMLQRVLDETRPPTPREGWWQRLTNYIFPRRLAALAWVSLAVLFIAAGLTWWQLKRPGAANEPVGMQARGPGAGKEIPPPHIGGPTPPATPTPGPPEGVTTNQQPGRQQENVPGETNNRRDGTRRPPQPTPPRARPAVPAQEPQPYEVPLYSGVTLGTPSNAPPPLVVPRGARRVKLKIQVVKNDYRQYSVTLQAVDSDKKNPEVWERTMPKGKTDAAGEWITVSVPVSFFNNKDYILRVSADAPSGRKETLALRQLRVEREDSSR